LLQATCRTILARLNHAAGDAASANQL